MNSRRKQDQQVKSSEGEGGELVSWAESPLTRLAARRRQKVSYILTQQSKNRTGVSIRDGYGKEQNMAKRLAWISISARQTDQYCYKVSVPSPG